jgi:hypothetical protein
VLELALQQYERIGSHVGVEQRAVPVVSFAAVEHQPIGRRGERFYVLRAQATEMSGYFRPWEIRSICADYLVELRRFELLTSAHLAG